MSERGQPEGSAVLSPHARVRWRRVVAYYLLVLGVSYGLVGGFLASGGSFQRANWVFFAQASALTPALLALVLNRWVWREPLAASLGLRLRRDRWLLVAWLAGWAVCLLALAFGLAVPGVRWDGSLQPAVDAKLLSVDQLGLLRRMAAQVSLPTVLLLVPFGILASVTISFLAACGEEIGWRGFVYGELRPLGFWRGTLCTGLLWLGWHLPLLALGYGYPQHRVIGVGLMTAHLLVMSVGCSYLRERASSSVVVGLFHGTTEAAALLAVAPLAGGSDITVGIASLSWIGAEVVVVCGLLVYDRFLAKEPVAWPRRSRVLREGS
jgi:membrane protease YdiL (CAAX protease family)